MNAQKLNDIYKDIHIAEKSDIESIKQLTVDYPFYHLPYVVLAKYYYDTRHYKFEDMLRQAAMRVKDRKELYHYIHGHVNETVSVSAAEAPASVDPDYMKFEEEELMLVSEEPDASEDQVVLLNKLGALQGEINEEINEEISLSDQDSEAEISQEKKAGISDFLEDFSLSENEKPEEFVFEGKHDNINLIDIAVDNDLIGEEIAAEFSFSRTFQRETEQEEPTEIEVKEEELQTEQGPTSQPITASEEDIIIVAPLSRNQDLRKHPVYQVETFVHEGQQREMEDLSPEKDFFAWLQHPRYIREIKESSEEEKEEKQDKNLDLIEKFITINPQISRPKKEFYNPENMAKKSEVVDLEYVTETLANIYFEQGNVDLAVRAYEKLSLQNPSKQAYFASLIEKIKKEKK